ncbi:MAG: response regulator [Candidatus Omnitrophota bacterium]
MEKKKILIVDDEEDFVRMIKLNLEKTGEYEVMTEIRAVKALAAAREFKPDLILLDIVMPGIDGGEVAYQLGSDKSSKNIPIVFLTAIMSEEESSSMKGIAGNRPFLSKSVAVDKLIECIEKNMNR